LYFNRNANEDCLVVAHRSATILQFKDFEAVSFAPVYTDCHAVDFYLYGVTDKEAFHFTFHTKYGNYDHYSISHKAQLVVQDGQLIVEGGQAAGGDAEVKKRYYFMPGLERKSMELVKEETIH
jgi:hypothetical protein